MQFENPRSQRVADQIQRELALLLQREVKDPRIGMVTITAVSVNRELDHANVYFTVITPTHRGEDIGGSKADTAQDASSEQDAFSEQKAQLQQTQAGLEKAAGFLRRELSHRLKLRVTPSLHFVYDKSTTEGNRLAALIDRANRDSETGLANVSGSPAYHDKS